MLANFAKRAFKKPHFYKKDPIFQKLCLSNSYGKCIVYFFREIASAIKKLLDAVNEVSAYIPGTSGKQALDQKKREFVKYSKRFSNTLKEFFRDGQ